MQSWITLLVIFGIILITFELFLPGGVLGVIGFLSLLAASLFIFIDYGFFWGVISLVGIATLAIAFLLTWLYLIRYSKLGEIFTLKATIKTSSKNFSDNIDFFNLVGKIGTTTTDLKSSGKALIDDKSYDVVSIFGFIKFNEKIEVVSVEGSNIKVKKV